MATTGLAEQVVHQVHEAVGGMYPLSSVGYDEADEIIRAAVSATLIRITGTNIGAGTARQVDGKLRDLARQCGSTFK